MRSISSRKRYWLSPVWGFVVFTVAAGIHAAPQRGTTSTAASGHQQKEKQKDTDSDNDAAIEDIVLSAMKTPISVREAPAIISIITAEQIEQQGFMEFNDALTLVPGFLPNPYGFGQFGTPIVRGMAFGALVLLDGMDMYDPVGFPLLMGFISPNAIQRAEVVSGPGGVLWGANSFVGVINVVSKTADDIDGVEGEVGFGSGVNIQNRLRAYVSAGGRFFGGQLKAFVHAAVDYHERNHIELPLAPIGSGLTHGSETFVTDRESNDNIWRRYNLMLNAQLGHWSLHAWTAWAFVSATLALNGTVTERSLEEDRIDCSNPNNKAICALRVDPTRLARRNEYTFGNNIAILRYRNRVAKDRIGVDLRAFFGQYIIRYDPAVFALPTSTLPGGLSVEEKFYSYRAGVSLDTNVSLAEGLRLLTGGEVFYDWMPINYAVFRVLPDVLPYVMNCPPPIGNNNCPVLVHYASNRLTSGFFSSLQYRPVPALALTGGVRFQFAAGKRGYDPLVLFEGAAVWNFFSEWNLKLNYAEGYRPPSLLKTDSGSAVSWEGNPDLKVERSRALQAEINARLLHDVGPIRQLSVRVDYAYTWVDDFISIIDSRFLNVSKIGVQVVEFLANVSFKRGHNLSFAYTLNDATSADDGKVRSIPAQWFTMTAVLNLWKRRLFFTTNVSLIGAWENPNQYPNHSGGNVFLGRLDAQGNPKEEETVVANWSDRVLDRVGASVLWNAGMRFSIPQLRTELLANFYNILDSRSYFGEGYYDLKAQFEPVSAPWLGMSFMARAKVTL